MRNYKPSYTEIETFVPSRAAPVLRRATRKYLSLEKVRGSSNFTDSERAFRTLTFKLNSEDPGWVINNARLVMPLRMAITSVHQEPDPDNLPHKQYQKISMLTNTDNGPMPNIAVSADPLQAFQAVECYINGRRYSKRASQYGNILSMCYQSKDEIGFADNNSLKPIVVRDPFANTGYPMVRAPGATYRNASISGTNNRAFDLTSSNTGFTERVRDFQMGLSRDGYEWAGNIFAKLNVGPFQNDARGDDNVSVPYCNDLTLQFTFDQALSKYELAYDSGETRGKDKMRNAMCRGLFEFATPITSSSYLPTFDHTGAFSRTSSSGSQTVHIEHTKFPAFMSLQWEGEPYIEVEWVEFKSLNPQYLLKAYEWEIQSSHSQLMPFPGTQRIATEYVGIGQNRLLVDSKLSFSHIVSRCLSVPDKIYMWVELDDLYKNAFALGGASRTCELKNIKIRVNQQSDLVSDPTQYQCFNWFKLNTNNNIVYPTWRKSPVYVFSPAEIAHPEFLANIQGIMSLQFTCDARLTQLQIEEGYGHKSLYMSSMGYSLVTERSTTFVAEGDDFRYLPIEMRNVPVNHPDHAGAGHENRTIIRNKQIHPNQDTKWYVDFTTVQPQPTWDELRLVADTSVLIGNNQFSGTAHDVGLGIPTTSYPAYTLSNYNGAFPDRHDWRFHFPIVYDESFFDIYMRRLDDQDVSTSSHIGGQRYLMTAGDDLELIKPIRDKSPSTTDQPNGMPHSKYRNLGLGADAQGNDWTRRAFRADGCMWMHVDYAIPAVPVLRAFWVPLGFGFDIWGKHAWAQTPCLSYFPGQLPAAAAPPFMFQNRDEFGVANPANNNTGYVYFNGGRAWNPANGQINIARCIDAGGVRAANANNQRQMLSSFITNSDTFRNHPLPNGNDNYCKAWPMPIDNGFQNNAGNNSWKSRIRSGGRAQVWSPGRGVEYNFNTNTFFAIAGPPGVAPVALGVIPDLGVNLAYTDTAAAAIKESSYIENPPYLGSLWTEDEIPQANRSWPDTRVGYNRVGLLTGWYCCPYWSAAQQLVINGLPVACLPAQATKFTMTREMDCQRNFLNKSADAQLIIQGTQFQEVSEQLANDERMQELPYRLKILMEHGNEQLVMDASARPATQRENLIPSSKPPGIF